MHCDLSIQYIFTNSTIAKATNTNSAIGNCTLDIIFIHIKHKYYYNNYNYNFVYIMSSPSTLLPSPSAV